MRRSRGLFFYLFLSTVACVGCGNGSAPEASDPVGSPAEALDVVVVEVSDGSGTGASAGSIETASHAMAGVSVDLLEVSRTGADALTVRWQYRTTGSDETMLGEGDDPYSLTREAYLVDDRKQKKYLVLMDASDHPVASALDKNHDTGSPLILAPGEPLTAWAKFPAPPADIERISIYLPDVEPFENVAIGR